MTTSNTEATNKDEYLGDKIYKHLYALFMDEDVTPGELDFRYRAVMNLIHKYGLEQRIDEQKRLIAAIDKNDTASFRDVIEGDAISYVDHGYSLLAKQIKRNAQVRIRELTAFKAKEV